MVLQQKMLGNGIDGSQNLGFADPTIFGAEKPYRGLSACEERPIAH
jgi:hypothetical protein